MNLIHKLNKPIIISATVLSMGLALGPAMGTMADAGGNMHYDGVDYFQSPVPCGTQIYDVTANINSVSHFDETPLADGNVNAQGTMTEEGNFSAVPDNGVGPTYNGHFETWDGIHATDANIDPITGNINSAATFEEHGTFNIVGKGTDGSTIKQHTNQFELQNPQGPDDLRAFYKDSCAQ